MGVPAWLQAQLAGRKGEHVKLEGRLVKLTDIQDVREVGGQLMFRLKGGHAPVTFRGVNASALKQRLKSKGIQEV